MQLAARPRLVVREMLAVLPVALGAAVVFTLAAAVFSQFHQVAAEDLNVHEASAVAAASNTQKITIADWGVQLVLPLGPGMPLMKYAVQGPDSVGLASTAVESYGSACSASHNGVGALVRVPQGGWANDRVGYLLGTIGGFDYVFEMPQTACGDIGNAHDAAAFEGIELEGAGVLSPAE